jgi:hypothetical protein
MFVDTLLPTCQKSPVGYYGEYRKIQMIVFYISNDQSKNQILQIIQILVSKYFKYIQMQPHPSGSYLLSMNF